MRMRDGQGRVLYLECAGGVAGDMLAGALLDLGDEFDEQAVRGRWKACRSTGTRSRSRMYPVRASRVCDFDVVLDAEHENHDDDMAYLHGQGQEGAHAHGRHHAQGHHDDLASSHIHVHAGRAHGHRGIADIERMLRGAHALTDSARALALDAFRILADAEASAHGIPVDEVHFHEVGAVADSIADIVAVSVLVDGCARLRRLRPLARRRRHRALPARYHPGPAPATGNICAACGLELRAGVG